MEIRSKVEFYRLWEAGVLGNRTLLFHSIVDAMNYHPPLQKIGFRAMGIGGGKWELAERNSAQFVAHEWDARGIKYVMDSSVPNEHSVMQGEICRTIRGLESFLVVGQALPPMRITMSTGRHQSYGGVATLYLLDKYMDPSSRDDLDMLLELYPDATIEFTCFDIDVGTFPGRNTIFWEVRNY